MKRRSTRLMTPLGEGVQRPLLSVPATRAIFESAGLFAELEAEGEAVFVVARDGLEEALQ